MADRTRPVAGEPITDAEDKRGLGRDAALTSLVGMATFGLSALTGPLLARALGTAGRGDLAAVIYPTQVIGWILLFGIGHSCAFYVSKRDRRVLVMTAWALAGVVGIPLVLVSIPVLPWFLDGHAAQTVPWFVAFLVLALLFLPMWSTLECLRGEGRVWAFNVLRAAPLVMNTVAVVVLFVVDRLTLTTALASMFLTHLVGWTAVIVHGRTWPNRRFDRVVARAQFDYGRRAAFGTLAMMVVGRLDQFVLVALVDPGDLGLYAVAATGASLTSPIGNGIALAMFPHVRAVSEPGLADERTRSALRWTLVCSSVVAVGMAIVSPFGIPLLFGEAFRGSVPPLLLLLPGQVANDLANVTATRLDADGRPGASSRALGMAAVVTVVGLVAAVPLFGIEGAAAVTSLSQFTYLAAATWYRRRGGESVERAFEHAGD